jgi:hypothetical protein
MLGNSSLLYLAEQQADRQIDDSYGLQKIATRRFWRLVAGASWHRLKTRLQHGQLGLLSLNDAAEGISSNSSRHLGTMAVPISLIRGSEGKGSDFDVEFRPLKPLVRDRWVSVAVAYLQGKSLPPVELIKVGDTYFVRDGHHRISVARAFGQQDIDAVVTIWDGERAN